MTKAVAVAQLVERSLPTLEVRGSNPAIGKICIELSTALKTRKYRKKPGNVHLKNHNFYTNIGFALFDPSFLFDVKSFLGRLFLISFDPAKLCANV